MGNDGGKELKIYRGFSSPRFTQVPDDILDDLLPDLSAGELKVLLYIVRRTFGFGKDADNISLKQLSSGIVTADGRQLDRGTGLVKSSVTAALLSLRHKGILIRTRNTNTERGNLPTTYRLRMAGEPLDIADEPPEVDAGHPLSGFSDKGVRLAGQGVSGSQDKGVRLAGQGVSGSQDKGVRLTGQGLSGWPDTQETVRQKTVEQETDRNFEASNDQPPKIEFDEDRAALFQYVQDFAREFGDEANIRSSLTRTVNLYRRSGAEFEEFVNVLYAARARTKEWTATITKASESGRNGEGKKNKMPYFFGIVEDMLGLKATQAPLRGKEDPKMGQ